MRVAMYYNNNDVRLEEQDKPGIGSNEVLLKTIASGICGSDVLEWYRIKKAPLVLGHEVAGEIVEIGKNVDNYQVGDRVVVNHHVPCNTCKYCLAGNHTVCETLHTTKFYPGGFSEYIRIPAINVEKGMFLLPEGMSYEAGSFVEPLACVVRGQRVTNLRPGQSVLIIGSGISGLLHLLCAKAQGAGTIVTTDINPFCLTMSTKLGAKAAINATDDVPTLARKYNNGDLFDLVIVCTGVLSAFDDAFNSVERGGTILCFATTDPGVTLPVPINDFWRNGIKIMPSYANSPYDAQVAIKLLASGRIDITQMITHRLPLAETAHGFKLMTGSSDSLKVIINPQE